MPLYSFTIWDGATLVRTEDLPDDKAAWGKAIQTVREAKFALSPRGSEWSLVVARNEKALYRIDVSAKKL